MTSSIYQPTATISATTTTATTAYPPGDGSFVWIYNSGTIPIYVNSGTSSVTAVAGNQVVPASSWRVLVRKPQDTNLAALTTSTTATVYFHVASSSEYQ